MEAKTKATTKATKNIPAKRERAPVVVPPNVAAAAKKEMAREDISQCEAIRKVAKQFKTTERKVLVKLFTEAPFKINKGTVARQIQEGRAA